MVRNAFQRHTFLDRSTIIIVAVADDDGTTAASPLRVPGGTRTFVRCSELHSRPCSRSYRTSGSAEQHGSAVLLSQMRSAHRAPESAQPPSEMLHLGPRRTRLNTSFPWPTLVCGAGSVVVLRHCEMPCRAV